MVFDLLAFLNDVTDNEENFNVIFKKMFPGPKFINPNAWYSHEDQKEEIKDPHSAARKEFNDFCDFLECSEIYSKSLEIQRILEERVKKMREEVDYEDDELDETYNEENPDDIEEVERMLLQQLLKSLKEFHITLLQVNANFEEYTKIMTPVYQAMHQLIDKTYDDANKAIQGEIERLKKLASGPTATPENIEKFKEAKESRRELDEKNQIIDELHDKFIEKLNELPPAMGATRKMYKEKIDILCKEQKTLNTIAVADKLVPGCNLGKVYEEGRMGIEKEFALDIAKGRKLLEEGFKGMDELAKRTQELAQITDKTQGAGHKVGLDLSGLLKHLENLQKDKYDLMRELNVQNKAAPMPTQDNFMQLNEQVRRSFKL